MRISPATYFNLKKRFLGMPPTEMRRLKRFEDENGKLKKLLAELSLDLMRPDIRIRIAIGSARKTPGCEQPGVLH